MHVTLPLRVKAGVQIDKWQPWNMPPGECHDGAETGYFRFQFLGWRDDSLLRWRLPCVGPFSLRRALLYNKDAMAVNVAIGRPCSGVSGCLLRDDLNGVYGRGRTAHRASSRHSPDTARGVCFYRSTGGTVMSARRAMGGACVRRVGFVINGRVHAKHQRGWEDAETIGNKGRQASGRALSVQKVS